MTAGIVQLAGALVQLDHRLADAALVAIGAGVRRESFLAGAAAAFDATGRDLVRRAEQLDSRIVKPGEAPNGG